MPTISLIPTQCMVQNASYLQVTDRDNMLTGINSDTYATVKHNRANTTAYAVKLYGFDGTQLPSDLPEDAVFTLKMKLSISSLVSNAVKGNIANTATNVPAGWSSTGTASADVQVLSFVCYPDVGVVWSDLKYALDEGYLGVLYQLKRTDSSTEGYAYIYGAELEVTWGSQDTDKLYVKENGAYKEVSKAYKKVNGVYVEQTDVASVFVSGTNYKRGNS